MTKLSPIRPRSTIELQAQWAELERSPTDHGLLELIVARPVKNERLLLETCQLSPAGGLEGDNWAKGCWKSLPDGQPDPVVQITLTNSRLARLVAGENREHWALAGDQLFVDLNLSYDNLPPGQKLAIGSAILVITPEPHTGCSKYQSRFGAEALRFISSPEGRRLNLRGIYAQVLQAGQIRVGDRIQKIS